MKKNKISFIGFYPALIYRLLIIMLLFSISRVVFYLFNTSMFENITFSHFLGMMLGGLRFDLTATLYTNSLFIVMNAIPFKFREKKWYQGSAGIVYFVTNSIMLAFNSIDIIYYRFTLRRTSWSVFKEFSNETGNTALIGQFFVDYWYIVLFWIFLIVSMVWLYRRVKINPIGFVSPFVYYPVYTLLFAATGGLFIGGVRGGFNYSTRPITISNATAYTNKPIEAGIVLNTPFSIYRTLERGNYPRLNFMDSDQLSEIYSPIHYPKNDTLQFKPRNVVVFILESFSKEYIGSLNTDLEEGQYKGYTPFLDELISQSYTYSHSFANGSKSIDAMPSILASIPSFQDPYVLSIYSNNKIDGLASLLKEKGYDCSFFHGAANGSMGFDAFARHSGFEHYYGKNEFNNDNEYDGRWGIWDEPFFDFFAETLNQKQEPFLGAIFSATSHHPFIVPDKYKNTFPKGTEEIHQTIGYTDLALRNFFEKARKMPWFQNTIFILTADHTNQVSFPKSKTDFGRYYIPIIIYTPSGELVPGVNDSTSIQQIDIMPTILGLLNYDKPYFAFGFDVFNDTNSFTINYNNSYYQVSENEYMLRVHDHHAKELYNYDKDPLLENNLNDSLPDISLRLNLMYKAFLQEYNNRLIDNKTNVDAISVSHTGTK